MSNFLIKDYNIILITWFMQSLYICVDSRFNIERYLLRSLIVKDLFE